MRYEYIYSDRLTDDRPQTADALLRHIWRIYDSLMVQTYRLHQLVIARDPFLDETFRQKWDLNNPNAAGWSTIDLIEDIEIDSWMQEDAMLYQPLNFSAREYSDSLVILNETLLQSRSSQLSSIIGIASTHDFVFYVTSSNQNIIFNTTAITGAETSNLVITIKDSNGNEVHSEDIPLIRGETTNQEINLPILSQGMYTMKAKVFAADRLVLKIPDNLAFGLINGYDSAGYTAQKMYFYVPEGMQSFAFYGDSVVPIEVYSPADNYATPVFTSVIDQNSFVITVPSGQDGKIWAISKMVSRGRNRLTFMNLPNVLSYSPEQMMVPIELTN